MLKAISPNRNRHASKLDILCHDAAKKYPGGITALAQRYGFNARTLQNKLNPSEPGCINLDEFTALLSATRDRRILDAIVELVSER